MDYTSSLLLGLVLAAGLAFIPASIAKSKGRSFGAWYVYGFLLWIVAVIHAAALPYPTQQVVPTQSNAYNQYSAPESTASTTSSSDALIKLKNLLDNQLITQEEYERKRKEIIDRI